MKLSYTWLCDYVNLDGLSIEEVKDKLTMGAFEVEEMSKEGPDLTGPVVVGEIIEIKTHPNADKIRLTKVKLKKDQDPVEIVCGAQNIEVGQRIPVALPGAVVVNRKTGEKLEIKAGEIRGVVSNGMLCSPPELGITDGDSEGILVLSRPGENGIEIGIDIIEHLELKPQYVMHVAPRSNRGDALSVIGLAREMAALTGRKLEIPEWKLNVDGDDKVYQDEEGEKNGFSTSIESSEDCPYFSIRLIENVRVGPSPEWLARRLESLGLRTVNNVVDITNYVMLEYGQPLHAYDLAKLSGAKIAVRRAKAGEKLTSIDGKVRDLNEEVLAIVDEKNVVGLAGIMGGKDSEISDTTTSIALEAAAFSPARVRRGSRLIGLSSDSSLRFERGVDVETVKAASDRAAYLIAKYCGAEAKVKSFFQSGSPKTTPTKVSMRLSQVKRLLDVDMPAADAIKYLTSLGFKADPQSKPDEITVEVPSFRRQDVTREIDLIEEVCRLFGYDNLPEAMPRSSACPERPDNLIRDIRSSLTGQGLSEAWLSSLRGEGDLENGDSVVRVLNPLSKDHQVLRQSLVPGMIDAVKYNLDRGVKDVWLFETGRSYQRVPEKSDGDKWATGVAENTHVAGIITGSLVKQVTKSEKIKDKVVTKATLEEKVDFFRIKGVAENMLERAGVPLTRLRFYRPKSTPSYLHPYRSCVVAVAPADKFPRDVEGKMEDRLVKLGLIGEIHPGYLAEKGLREAAFVFELDLGQIAKCRVDGGFKEPATTPVMTRDLTVDMLETTDHAAVQGSIEMSANATLVDVELVSIYPLEEGTRSLSYRLTFQDRDKTLTNEEIDKTMTKIRDNLVSKMGGKFRA
jgi:phenylalanyl-tRNA synthetase beta chain